MGDTVASPIRDAAVAFSSSRDATLKTTEAHSDVDDDNDYDDDDSDSDTVSAYCGSWIPTYTNSAFTGRV